MKYIRAAAALAVLSTGAIAKQQAMVTMAPVPADQTQVCFYAGLTYSKHAVLTVDVPLRRESPQATQKRLLICDTLEGEDTLGWVPHQMQ